MENSDLNYAAILNHFIANSIFTKKQTSIIYNKMLKAKPIDNISSGAYYRQLAQCRNKTRKTVYTMVLLQLLNVVDTETFSVLDRLNNQLSVILNKQSDEIDPSVLNGVISLIDNVIKRLVLI
jgi:2-oxoglutarate dehydrogenase complex dehydrogenase (E1) component-like enzyme